MFRVHVRCSFDKGLRDKYASYPISLVYHLHGDWGSPGKINTINKMAEYGDLLEYYKGLEDV